MRLLKKIGEHLPETPTLCFIIALVGVLMLGSNAVPTDFLAGEPSPQPSHQVQTEVVKITPTPCPDPMQKADGVVYDIPETATSFKTWMSYRAITSKSSIQWQLQQDAWTDTDGFRRYGKEGYYMVALGTYYAEQCGKVFDITFEEGTTIRCIVGDTKADQHTDELHQHHNGNVVEFIVDGKAISNTCKRMGDMSYAKGVNLKGKPIQIKEVKE